MATALLNIRIDKQLKLAAQEIAKNMGIPFSALVSGMLTKITRTKKIEFEAYTENGLLPSYEKELLDEVQNGEVVFVSKNKKQSREFLESL